MKKLLNTLIVLCVLSLCFCAGTLYLQHQEKAAADAALEEIRDMKPDLPEQSDQTDQTDVPQSLPLMDFTDLMTQNPDIVAWLTIPDTQIDYPIVQGKDNDYYLSHDVKKRYNRNGTLFLDYRAHVDFTGFNSVIYGHHMKSGNMFQNLIRFKEDAFWNSHASATLYTPAHTYRLEVVAVAVVGRNSALYQYAFASPAERTAHLEEIRRNAKFYRDAGVTEDDRMITLSTCSYEFKNARTLVMARICDIGYFHCAE